MKVYPLVMGPVQTNCYMISIRDKAVIIDPVEAPEKLIQYLNKHKLELEAILLTHGHFDHIGAVNDLAGVFNVPIYAHKKEKPYFENPELNLSTMMYQKLVLKPDFDYRYLEDGENFKCIGLDVKVFHVPGHTMGSLCYYFKSEQIIFTGDTLFAHSIGRTDLIHGNHKQLVQAIKKKLLNLPEATLVYPGHGDCTTIADEIKENPYLQES